jgi:glutamate-1-semialdehyde 2,1-aminomutase
MLLILDEVMTGFRVAPGGAAALYGVRPDLVTLGKIIGGGLPVGAYGGRRDLMQNVSPVGPVYQAGTLSGNPLAMAAGIATLDALAAPGTYEALEAKSRRLEEGLAEAVREAFVPSPLEGEGRVRGRLERGISPLTPTPSPTRGEGRMAARVQRVGSMLTLFFSGEPVTDAASAARCDTAAFGRFFGEMLRRGIYLPPSQFEAWFVSLAHTEADIDRTIRAARAALKA